jgi:integrase/recombinase XerD
MFLFKRNGIYHLEYEEPRTGRKKRISTKKELKKDALSFVSEYKKMLEEKHKKRTISFSQFEKEYLDLKQKSSSLSYITSIKLTLRIFQEEMGDVLLEDVRFSEAETFIINIHKNSPSLASLYYRTLKAAFSKAVEWEYIQSNPFKKLKLPKVKINIPLFISAIELEMILENVVNIQLKQIYRLALHTGLRLSEIINLRWSAIDFKDKTLKVEHSEDFITKGKKERLIPMNSVVYSILNEKRVLSFIITIKKRDHIFSKCVGVKFNSDYVSKQFKKAVKKTERINKSVHFHSLRHSFASLLVQKGVSLYVVKDLLGHTEIRTTQIYSHLQQQNFVDAVKVLEN